MSLMHVDFKDGPARGHQMRQDTTRGARTASIRAGLERARARGVRLGRPPTTNPHWLARMEKAIRAVRAGASYRAAAKQFRVSRKAIIARTKDKAP